MSAPTEAAPAAGGAETAKKKSKLPLIIIVVVALAAAGGGWFFFMRKSAAADTETADKSDKSKKASKSKAAEEDTEGDDSADDSDTKAAKSDGADKTKAPSMKLPDDSKVTQVIELQPFVVNLADATASRYLRVSVSVGLGGESGAEAKPDALLTTRIRNALLAVLTTKSSDDVLTVEGKTQLRKELLRAAQRASDEADVEAIYITEFIVQM